MMALIWNDRVLETSATTGTGAFTLAAAVAGFQRFADAMSVSDTCYYFIEAKDANGNPSGDWESGLGTYSSSNTLTRTTVQQSSNGDAAVNFGAGTKYVALTATAAFFGAFDAMARAAVAIPPTTQTWTSYTAVLGDANGHIRFTNGSAVAYTIPPNSSVAFPLGTVLSFTQAGAGIVTLTPGSGVTLNSRGGLLASAGQFAVVHAKKVATNEWDVIGDVA